MDLDGDFMEMTTARPWKLLALQTDSLFCNITVCLAD
jgi:hypothetical protein